ncbi:MAG: serine/threonine-protein kinase [Gemmatimonadota bacterium]|nr:serine/threonine-protein kinase [Gemmatimonadota bacterium]MDH5198803.1 serine/threonine-protein kinase [Gemmatimonadota bacterium]
MADPLRPSSPQIDPAIDAAALFGEAERVFAGMFHVEQIVAANEARALFVARHLVLERQVALRVHLQPDTPGRRWFERETVLFARADHPGIRPVHSAGFRGDWAYRVSKWIEGESLEEAVSRGPRPIPDVVQLARDLLSALDYVHAEQIIVRRITPSSVMLTRAGRAIITDLRWSNTLLEFAGPEVDPRAEAFLAPEVREGRAGDPGSDAYAAAALLYYAITGKPPATDPLALRPPTELRAVCPKAVERVVMHALQPPSAKRYLTIAEMGADLLSDLGDAGLEMSTVPVSVEADPVSFEKYLRRALGDDYELLNPLGAGAFGRVYRVRDLALEREVALKVLHPVLTSDAAVVERFRREAQLAAQVRHPHIVDVFDIGGRSGLLWYTMAYIAGPNLAQWVELHGPLPLDRAFTLLAQALSALTHAHEQGLVHRDLKPENILIETEPEWTVQLTDFGLALAFQGVSDDKRQSRSGTPEYAAPEQMLGERVDQRADLYSLSLTLMFGLTGRSPFAGASVPAVLAQQSAGVLPDLRALRPELPESLIRVLRRGAARDPADRFPSAVAYLRELERALQSWQGSPWRLFGQIFGRRP